MTAEYVSVRMLDIAYQADIAYTYFVGEEWRAQVEIGCTVCVPFGRSNRRVTGIVTGFVDECSYPEIKPIISVVRDGLRLSSETVRICLFMHKRCYCTFASAVKAVLPPGYDPRGVVYYTAVPGRPQLVSPQLEFFVRRIESVDKVYERDLINEFGKECTETADNLVRDGYILRGSEQARPVNQKTATKVRLAISDEDAERMLEDSDGLTEKQKELLILLLHYDDITLSEIEDIGGLSASIVNTLCKKGIVKKERERIERIAYADEPIPDMPVRVPNEEQAEAINELCALADSDKPQAALLLGVTGSGKTLVIIETVKHVINSGKTAIIMLPEIALASHALLTYRAAFGDALAVIHSKLSAGERVDAYRAMLDGKVKVVLGTRSAVFAPLKDLGIIVMDEEQEGTYKSELSPKYHARDIARFRAGINSCLMLLSSATPSVESYYKAKTGAYKLIKLTHRVSGLPLPKVIIEDIRGDRTLLPDKLIGKRLYDEISNRTSKGEQAILFAGRRGYNSQIICHTCGDAVICPNCSVSLTYHAYIGENIKHRRLCCHYCGYTAPVPVRCPSCGSEHMGFIGFGTQKLQEELAEKFPHLTALRMDSDTTSLKYSHDRMLGEFKDGKADILFGTQMICKGLDFAGVTLASVVSVDGMLYMNDYRASERTFSLITQLIGRAGRAGDGLAVLQTMNPEHETLRLAAKQDYESFAESEIAFRKAALFPPFCGIAVFCISAETAEALSYYAQKFPTELCRFKVDETKTKVRIFGPYPEGVTKIGGRFRQKIIIKYSDNDEARQYLGKVYASALSRLPLSVKLDLDINPTVV